MDQAEESPPGMQDHHQEKDLDQAVNVPGSHSILPTEFRYLALNTLGCLTILLTGFSDLVFVEDGCGIVWLIGVGTSCWLTLGVGMEV